MNQQNYTTHQNSQSVRRTVTEPNRLINTKLKQSSLKLVQTPNQILPKTQEKKKLKLPTIINTSKQKQKSSQQKKSTTHQQKKLKYADSYFHHNKKQYYRYASKPTSLTKKQKTIFKQWDSVQLIQQQYAINEKLIEMLNKLPQSNKRNKDNMQKLYNQLSSNNPFFKKLPQAIIYSLLRIAKVVKHEPNDVIYKRGDQSHSFYLILDGKIYVFDRVCFYKKILGVGELLGQQILFQQNEKIKSLVVIQNGSFQKIQNAVCIENCCYLDIDFGAFQKMKINLLKHGFKQELHILENLISRTFYSKFSQRKFKIF